MHKPRNNRDRGFLMFLNFRETWVVAIHNGMHRLRKPVSVVLVSLLISSFSYAESEVFSPSPSFLKKRTEEFYQIPPVPSIDEKELSNFIEKKIEKFGSRIPEFHKMVNEVDTRLTVKELMKSSSLHGFPNFGNSESKTNQDLRNMILFTFDRLENLPKVEDADRVFLRLAKAFTHCQQVQYRIVREVFLDLMDKDSLKTRVALLLDDLKKKWLMQTIFKMEHTSSADLDPHLENSYLNAIGEEFGISGFEGAKVDRLANKKIEPAQARKVFLSYARADEIISYVHDDFTSSQDAQEQAEVFNWVSKKNYELDKIYDENGLITTEGVQKILLDLEILVMASASTPAPAAHNDTPFNIFRITPSDIIKRQEKVLAIFFPTTGFSSWKEFEGRLEKSKKLAPVREALDKERIKLVVYSPQNIRDPILTQGLLNQYQTGSTRGYEGTTGRFAVERGQLNMTKQEYEEVPITDRPKYGMVLSE
ncbi:MAG: hypothetical protein ABIQ95_07150, partial [Bdellovibrionia bacterium]